ncbi:hypothetical protein C8D77_1011122 [Mesorhizobium loti]|uniref:Uncharacterized protein n=1 Tax=Rhizobium loti TaxID=381 RepID=A0A8E2WHI0_RHILI|nr:hypothetical protein C8D77_1011122 [Mesorhizobium loti]
MKERRSVDPKPTYVFHDANDGALQKLPALREPFGPPIQGLTNLFYFTVMAIPLRSALTCRPTCLPVSSSWAPLSLVMTIT